LSSAIVFYASTFDLCNKNSLTHLLLTTLGQETRWAYSTTLPSPHRVHAAVVCWCQVKHFVVSYKSAKVDVTRHDTVICPSLTYLPTCRELQVSEGWCNTSWHCDLPFPYLPTSLLTCLLCYSELLL